MAEAMTQDTAMARSGELAAPRVIVSSNGFVIALYHRSAEFRETMDAVDVIDADGMPLVLFTRAFWKHPLPERLATTDFIHDAAAKAIETGVKFYFLGARPGIAAAAAETLRAQYPGLQIVGTRHGYFTEAEESEICDEIRASGAEVLWVGMGTPRQESFAIRRRAELHGLAWIRTCGGLFDHVGAHVPRAPMWMQNVGLEWLHRTMIEPRRLAPRYLSTNFSALYHLIAKSRERP